MSIEGHGKIPVRRCTRDDLSAVLELARACYGSSTNPPEWWRWRYFTYRPESSGIFVAELAGKVVGIRPVTYFRYSLGRRALTGALFTDVMVHPEFRRRGIFSRLVSVCVEEAWRNGADFISTMPNDLSLPGFLKSGWVNLGDRRLMVCPLRPAGNVRRGRGTRWWSLLTAIPAALTELRHHRLSSHGPIAEEAERFDPSADALADLTARKRSVLALRRDAAWLNWRYCDKPRNEYGRFVARERDGSISGVVVTHVEMRFGLRAGFLVELVSASTESTRTLVAAAIRSLRRQGAEAAAAVMSESQTIRDLFKLGFLAVPGAVSPKHFHTVFLPRPGSEGQFASLLRVDRWSLTLGDWDAI
ncbi:GNAT family N-acetyltransferase [candidate division WOR-3 bacterium]|nr:GNAT family N-acetyltransferase [candidate division WOR-3 bacterium]